MVRLFNHAIGERKKIDIPLRYGVRSRGRAHFDLGALMDQRFVYDTICRAIDSRKCSN